MTTARRPLADRIGLLRDRLEVRRDKVTGPGADPRPFEAVVAELTAVLGTDTAGVLADPVLAAHEQMLKRRLDAAAASNPFPVDWNASRTLARLCWLVVRARNPATVVETGVAAGLTSSYILAALAANDGDGHLHSIDPVVGTPAQVKRTGWLVPDELRGRWTLHRARSRRVLPRLLHETGGAPVFVHDGLHTEATMRWELATAQRQLPGGGVIVADDVERNPAFATWARSAGPAYWSAVETEFAGHLCGIAVWPDAALSDPRRRGR